MTTSSPDRVAFGPLDVAFDRRVLTPRAWTLAQSEWAAALAEDVGEGALLELCAGAGQIGLCAAVLSGRPLVQVEVDPIAAGFARENAARAGWAEHVDVRCGDLEEVLDGSERFPLVLADPPYLRTDGCERYPDDPKGAIDGGEDGLAVVRTCLLVGAAHLEVGGPMLLQVAGPPQAAEVAELAAAAGLEAVDQRVIDEERAVLLLRRR